MDEVTNNVRKQHPKEKSNFLSSATFFYTIPTFVYGHKHEFNESNLYETLAEYKSNTLGNKLEGLWDKEVVKAAQAKRPPSLLTVLVKAFRFEFMLWGCILVFIECVVKPAQSLSLCRLMSYYNHNNEEPMPKTHAYLYALGIVLLTLLNTTLLHPFMVNVTLIGLKMKIACCSLLYRKSLKLNRTAFEKASVGQMLNLLSTDVLNFHRCALMTHYVWVGPLQCVIITYLIYQEFEFPSILGIFLLLLCIPLYIYLGKQASKFRMKAALKTDIRVRFLNEVIMGIQVIKMYAWEKAIQKLVVLYRKNEMKYLRVSAYVKSMYLTFDILIIPITLYVTVLGCTLFNSNIDAQKFFTLTIFYASLRLTMATFFPQGLGLVAETLVSIKRMNRFLLNNEIEPGVVQSVDKKNNRVIEISDVTASWTKSSRDVLIDVDLSVTRGSLTAIVGSVGSGKSSLLNLILNELCVINGEIKIGGSLSYASQEPWIFSSTIRQNIVFGEAFDLTRYNDVIRVCALEEDFKLLPYSDKTLIGRRGASLSGGQKARISLARAIYKQADIYLLDDPLSAIDAHVGKQIFYECIKEFLKEKTVILVTHQLQYLNHVDCVIVLDNGSIKAKGSFEDVQKDCENFPKVFGECVVEKRPKVEKLKSGKTNENNDDDQEVVKEQKTEGAVSKSVYKNYIMAGANCTLVLFIAVMFLSTQTLISGGAYFMTYWVNTKQSRYSDILTDENNSSNASSLTEEYYDLDHTYIYTYSLITAFLIIVSISRSLLFYKTCMKSSENLHNRMFDSVVHATMRFFNTNSPGRILNRFANDMGAADSILPTVTIDTTQILLMTFASLILICIVNFWLLLPAVVIGATFYYLKVYCLKTSRNIKRLEGVTRSPVFEHISASLQGLSTIRAFEAQNALKKEFDVHQDLNSSSYHMFLTTSHAFGYILDCIGAMYIAIVTFSFLVIGHETYGGNVGLAITQCLAVLMNLQWGIRQTAEMESQMTSVERILEYNSIEHEAQSKNKAPKNWPQFGEIKFVNVYFTYYPKDPPVLKNINFTIRPLEKVGIVGRTGSGKSSLLNALFLLSDLTGSIYIDNIDITNLNLQDLRSKISIIPQEPVIFSGSFRKNLDPFDEFRDEDLWKALEEVELKDVVSQLQGGLHSNLCEGGSNLSVGQRQLICLARAILRNNKILVLDEATANVDSETDDLIQKTIRKKFDKCTVLTIAHRLNTVMDSDKIMVVSDGKVVEFDRPNVLLQNRNGYFYEIVQENGKTGNVTT